MFIITQFLFVLSNEITWTNYSFTFPQFVPLVAEKTVFSRSLEEFGQILNISIEYDGDMEESICKFDYQSITLDRQPESLIALVSDMQQIDIDTMSTEEIQQGFSHELVSYAISNRNLILLEKKGTIHHMYYNIGAKFTNQSTHQLIILQNGNENQQIFTDNENYYYVDHQQLIRFTIKDKMLEQTKIQNWKKVNGHFKMFINRGFVYLINGSKGMRILELQNNFIIQVNKFVIEDFHQDLNLVDYAIEGDWLYLLDFENGVFRFNLTSLQLDKRFFIAQKGCSIISVRHNQIMLIQQQLLHSEVYEGRIVDNGWGMTRMKTVAKQIIRNIQQFNNFALLISNPTNNMYQKHLLDNFSDPYLSKGSNLHQMEFLGMDKLDEEYVVGIYRYGAAIYFAQERTAKISCQARLSQQNRVTIHLNSTNCLNKNQSDAFNYCQSRLEYVFDVHNVLMSQQEEDLYVYLCILALSIIMGLFLAIIFVFRRYQLKKEKIDYLRKSKKGLQS
ncbi:unnamed protein product (macronuclear) [Paramecium tetraurelia]|uniref:Transmembrane protein n=1 Tax=Paramecium tetraurelia TaxID=5888 RepID=A0C213_PARTE|nr:uncharacterized protein GSPATT00034307001 [Paramecium tetraurelia]CAK64830.1 unnamed protein product [Paramecium tetraurelia]|eukprot:XP_001432227.1 hypothetical protein (macronuclear) [Paramecium tetraurelia strain d4-2]